MGVNYPSVAGEFGKNTVAGLRVKIVYVALQELTMYDL